MFRKPSWKLLRWFLIGGTNNSLYPLLYSWYPSDELNTRRCTYNISPEWIVISFTMYWTPPDVLKIYSPCTGDISLMYWASPMYSKFLNGWHTSHSRDWEYHLVIHWLSARRTLLLSTNISFFERWKWSSSNQKSAITITIHTLTCHVHAVKMCVTIWKCCPISNVSVCSVLF